jgi:hypothetical protein
VLGESARPVRWVLSNDAERLCAPGERANAASCLPFMMAESEAQGCRKCAAAVIGAYLGYTGRSADAFGTAARDPEEKLEELPICFGAILVGMLFISALVKLA